MCIADVLEMHEYLNESPPAHEILAAVHLEKKSRHKQPRNKADVAKQVFAMQQTMGAAAQPFPPELRDLMSWARDEQTKLRVN